MATSFKNESVVVGTTTTDLYTCPGSTKAVTYGLTITNKNLTTDRVVSVDIYDASATATRAVIKNLTIPFTDTYIHASKINLEASDVIRIIVDAGTDVDAFVSILEVS